MAGGLRGTRHVLGLSLDGGEVVSRGAVGVEGFGSSVDKNDVLGLRLDGHELVSRGARGSPGAMSPKA
eukprot:6094155-Alexandrium_andersonii.AAC.1